jgi:hypothetical protein
MNGAAPLGNQTHPKGSFENLRDKSLPHWTPDGRCMLAALLTFGRKKKGISGGIFFVNSKHIEEN